MDRPRTSEDEYRTLLGLKHQSAVPVAEPSTPRSLTSSQASNAVTNAFLAFHNSRMTSPTGDGTPHPHAHANAPAGIQVEGAVGANRSNANKSSGPLLEHAQTLGQSAGPVVDRGSSANHAGATDYVPHRPARPNDPTPIPARGRGSRGRIGVLGGRGRLFEVDHVRGRGRGGHTDGRPPMQEDTSHQQIFRGNDHGQRHHRGGGREGHRGRHVHPGRGRGPGYDADFDRGKTFHDRKAESQKQLFQAPMGYKSLLESSLPERESPERESKQVSSRADEASGSQQEHIAAQEPAEIYSSECEDTKHDVQSQKGVLDSPEPASRPGIINTGIDIAAMQQDSQQGKSVDRNKRRKIRERRTARDDPNGSHSRDDRAPPARHAGPPPFPGGPPLGHLSPHPHLHGRIPSPPPPKAFHRHPGGAAMFPPPDSWQVHPSQHRQTRPAHYGRHDDDNGRKPGRNPPTTHGTVVNRGGTSRDSHERASIGLSSPTAGARQLFDPSKHDPVRFSLNHTPASSRKDVARLAPDAQSVVSSATHSSMSSLSVSSSSYKSRSSSHKDSLLDEVESTSLGAGENALLRELKASYRIILNVEAKLQDEDSLAKTALQDLARANEDGGDSGLPKDARPDEYWAKLTQLHREGAEAFHSFMERCMDPMVPASIHSIPQKYNLPSRMWNSAFLILFERMRFALLQSTEERESDEHDQEATPSGNVLDHLTDFVYYAYTLYTQLLEQQTLSAFRGTWIEQLGDVAQYRLALAGLASKKPRANGPVTLGSSGSSLKSVLDNADREDNASERMRMEPGNDRIPRKQLVSRKDRKKGFPGMPAKLDEDLELAEAPGNSIGAAALDDWDLVESDIWRTVAREWYFLGLAETPGTGRLHHHLAVISEGDELRALYHFSKSVAASHPYVVGRDSILAFFGPKVQAARLQPDVPALSLFIHLHGLLYTGNNLNTFDLILARLEEKLEDTFKYAQSQADRPPRRSVQGKQRDDPSQRLNRDATWIMMAVINISATMEFGREGGVLKSALSQAHGQKKSEKQSSRTEKKPAGRSDPTPSEASLTDLARQVERLGLEASKMRSFSRTSDQATIHVPTSLRLAMRLTVTLLVHAIRHPTKPGEADPAINPYITILLTFLSTLAHNPTALAVIRSDIPWEKLISLFDTLPKYASDLYLRNNNNIPSRLLGLTLPEDWCIRGMEWTGKQLFGRGYWKGKLGTAYLSVSQSEALGDGSRGESHGYSMPESEQDVLAERYEGPSMPAHAGGPQSVHQASIANFSGKEQLDEDGDPPTDRETVARLRWKRVALAAAWLARAVPFIDTDEKPGKVSLDTELCQQILEQDAQKLAEVPEKGDDDAFTQDAMASYPTASDAASDVDEDEFLVNSGDENETVKELKARRRELKALLRQSRESRHEEKQQDLAIRQSTGDTAGKRSRRPMSLNALAGYTTLVFDTNVFLESMDLFIALLTSKSWTLVVPLAVVTELDGLRTKEDQLGAAATQAINFLEDAIKTYSMNLKVQTSRGNYLRDLNIRREDIDFGHAAKSGASNASKDTGAGDASIKSMDDVILNVAIWQKTHWLDRRALLGIKLTDKVETGSSAPVKTILVSSDRTLRLKGKARGLEVCDAPALQQLLEKPPNG